MTASRLVRLALRNVIRNQRRSLISGAMVALGVVAVVFVQAYLRGISVLTMENTIASTGALQVLPKGYLAAQELNPIDSPLPERGALRAQLQGDDAVAAIAPRLRFSGMISAGESSAPFSGRALDPNLERMVSPRGPGTPSPQLIGPGLTSATSDEIVLGRRLGELLKVEVGHTVTLLSQTRTGSMDAIDLTVAGFFNSRDQQESRYLIVVPLAAAQRLLHMPELVTGFAVGVRQGRNVDATARHLAALLAGHSIEVRTWSELVPFSHDVMRLQDALLGIVILIVAMLVLAGVVNTMLMSVFERTREIGTLMSIGLRRRAILLLFLFEAGILGTIAGVLGAVVGAGLILYTHQRGVPFLIPAMGVILNRPVLDPSFLLQALLGTLLAAMLGGLYPARRAARLRPVEALQAS